MSKVISTHIVEIRIKPDPLFLDKRGAIVKQIVGNTLNNWTVSNNKIEFESSERSSVSAFFSYSNLGFVSKPPSTKDDFLRYSREFIKLAWQYIPTDSITRMGVRSIFLTETSDFSGIFEAYKKKYLKIGKEELSIFGGDLVDLGLAFDFVDGEDFFKIMAGPMEKNQSKNIFGDEAFASGKYLELDYYRKNIPPFISTKNVFAFINKGVEKAEKISQEII